jgi:hypothetical protein
MHKHGCVGIVILVAAVAVSTNHVVALHKRSGQETIAHDMMIDSQCRLVHLGKATTSESRCEKVWHRAPTVFPRVKQAEWIEMYQKPGNQITQTEDTR